MTDHISQKRHKLSHEILGLLAVAFAISLFLFEFLSLTAASIVNQYSDRNNLILTDIHSTDIQLWILSVSLVTAILFFIILFLFLLGQKLAYINSITKGVEALQAHRMDFVMPLEGNNELTQLAETINYLSAAEKQIQEKERALNEEKEQFIRSLSHDIRTPLTSIMAYSELLIANENNLPQEQKEQLILIRKKAEQIKELTDILLDGGQRNPEEFEDAGLLMKQLAGEFEDSLEDQYPVSIDLADCPAFAGVFDVRELQRIFDNLISNIQKYADPDKPVLLRISLEKDELVIRQKNHRKPVSSNVESHHMGLNSIRRIAHHYGGRVEIQETNAVFGVTVVLSKF